MYIDGQSTKALAAWTAKVQNGALLNSVLMVNIFFYNILILPFPNLISISMHLKLQH